MAKKQLETVRSDMDFHLEELNIDEDEFLRERYNDDVPVVALNGQDVFKHQIDIGKFRKMLSFLNQGIQAHEG